MHDPYKEKKPKKTRNDVLAERRKKWEEIHEMKTTSQILQEYLLSGRSLTKFDFMQITPTHSVCLAQRVEELRKDGWVILDRQVKGKGNLKEYYLEKTEIERIKARNRRVEQLVEQTKNIAETSRNEPEKEEQMSLLLGGKNYG